MVLSNVVQFYIGLSLNLLSAPILLACLVFACWKVWEIHFSAKPEAVERRQSVSRRMRNKSVSISFSNYYHSGYLFILCVFSNTAIAASASAFRNGGSCISLHPQPSLVRLSRGTTYLLLLLRIHTVYGNSLYGPSEWVVKCLAITTILISVLIAGLYPVLLDGSLVKVGSFGKLCKVSIPTFIIVPGLLFDVFMNGWCLVNFTHPLLQMNRNVTVSKSFRRLATKVCVITCTQIVSLGIFLFSVAILGSTVLGPIDLIINAICFGLMTNWFSHSAYKRVCCISIWCSLNICGLCCTCSTSTMRTALDMSDPGNFSSTERTSKEQHVVGVMSTTSGSPASSRQQYPAAVTAAEVLSKSSPTDSTRPTSLSVSEMDEQPTSIDFAISPRSMSGMSAGFPLGPPEEKENIETPP